MSDMKHETRIAYCERARAENSYSREMDALLAAAPPEITWENRNGVMVAAEVNDPHTEKPNTPRPIYIEDES